MSPTHWKAPCPEADLAMALIVSGKRAEMICCQRVELTSLARRGLSPALVRISAIQIAALAAEPSPSPDSSQKMEVRILPGAESMSQGVLIMVLMKNSKTNTDPKAMPRAAMIRAGTEASAVASAPIAPEIVRASAPRALVISAGIAAIPAIIGARLIAFVRKPPLLVMNFQMFLSPVVATMNPA